MYGAIKNLWYNFMCHRLCLTCIIRINWSLYSIHQVVNDYMFNSITICWVDGIYVHVNVSSKKET